ncbi:Type IV secretory pathway, protease TraF [Novosphingobium resinovorum]|jgi:conjugative transfer signal peptidase TraF|uniref:Type IV secretory pathway, protease TraF n=1 Tax=Novosphingobium resinovorum TaxID=158500 RepID=A0A031K1I7_9SPHN|nr:S26 family signal peptidase [Novosphingobium resinovorum]EZP82472.1 Type IV secretory pathway, protease TraF [Novosphingobium resinovorum]
MTRKGYGCATGILAGLFGSLFVIVTALAPAPRLMWNASASEPIGLYRVTPGEQPVRGDLVVIEPPARLAHLLAERRYLPVGVPLLKQVAAGPGARVCRHGDVVTIDGTRKAVARPRDRLGRALPTWQGCRIVGRGELFLLAGAPDSMDSRYFGPIPADGLLGRASPILTRDAPGQPLRWRGVRAAPASPSHCKGDSPCK